MIKKLKHYLDFKLIGILSLAYLAFVIVYAGKNAYLRNYGDIETDWGDFVFANAIDWLFIVIFMTFIAFTTKYLMQKKTRLVYIAIMHLFFSFFIGFFTISLSWVIELMRDSNDDSIYSFTEIFGSNFFLSYIRLIDLHFLIYLSLVTIIYMYYYFQKVQESKMKTVKLQDQLSKSHLKFLQSQMHPHFLFNTLNGIHSLMDISIDKSKSMVVDLSDLLRSVLDKKDQNLIELQEELEILKKYIHIKKTRFSDQLNISLNVEDHLENILVPNMYIQPIVENSTKHGYGKNHISMDIIIDVYRKNNKLIVKIQNNGKALSKKLPDLLKNGTGLSNLNERLRTLYKDDYTLRLNNTKNGVVTEVRFPAQLSVSEMV